MKTMTLAMGGAGVIAVTVVAAVVLRPIQDDLRTERQSPQIVEPEVTDPAPETDQAVTIQSEPEGTAEPEAAPENEVVQAEPIEILPQLLQRRFEPDGAFLVSGTAAPGIPLAVMIDGAQVERVDIGADGAFNIVGFIGFSDVPRIMTLVSDPDGTPMLAEQTFIFDANPAPAIVATVEHPLEAEPEVEVVGQGETIPQNTVDAPDELAQSETEADGPVVEGIINAPEGDTPEVEVVVEVTDPLGAAEPATPAILSVTGEGVEVVQPAIPADAPPEVMSTVALDTITYDPSGEVVLQGRALGQGFVQVYVDNAPISRLPVDSAGRWRGDLPDVDTGVYTLRIDEVDAEGDVVSRIETPFLREDPEDVVEAMADEVDNPNFTIATRTVQPGATLWAIAEERYGSGVLYVNVFEANKDRIRDPDLIYPGQVFTLPEDDS